MNSRFLRILFILTLAIFPQTKANIVAAVFASQGMTSAIGGARACIASVKAKDHLSTIRSLSHVGIGLAFLNLSKKAAQSEECTRFSNKPFFNKIVRAIGCMTLVTAAINATRLYPQLKEFDAKYNKLSDDEKFEQSVTLGMHIVSAAQTLTIGAYTLYHSLPSRKG